jgi:hypothetical protein
MMLQTRWDVRPAITETVVATITKVDHEPDIASEVDALLKYIRHVYFMRNVMKERKQWDEDRQAKVSAAIAVAMKQWDEEHYPRLLAATWGWHPFYPAFLTNPLCSNFTPEYPLHNSVVEGSHVHSTLLQQCHVERVYPVPWSVLLLRCFLKYHRLLPPLISHPFSGATVSNVTTWLKLADEDEGEGWRAWHLATNYLKEEGYLVFAGARQVETRHEWLAELDVARMDLKNPNPHWWAQLRTWCHATQIRAVQDMAFHDKASWLNAWVIRDQPTTSCAPLACYDHWLQHREDLDIGYVLAAPGSFPLHL